MSKVKKILLNKIKKKKNEGIVDHVIIMSGFCLHNHGN